VTRETIYGFVAAEKTTYPVRLLCRVLQVSPSGLHRRSPTGSAAAAPRSATPISTTRMPGTGCTTRGPSTAAPTAPSVSAEIRERDPQGQGWNRKQ